MLFDIVGIGLTITLVVWPFTSWLIDVVKAVLWRLR